MLKRLMILLIIITTYINANSINIAVASNVTYAIDAIIKEYNKINPNTKVNVTIGSSGKLTAQIKHGAPYDIFMSADMKYPSYLYKNSIAKNKPKVYAQGAVSLLSTKQRDFSKGIEILLDKDIKRVAIANPKTAPYGKASKEALKAKNIYSKISDKFIYAESISQSISYTLKATDIGLVAKSSLYSPKLKRYKKDINYIDIPTSLYTPINQGIVILKDNNITREFYEFVLSNKTKEILSKYGYIVK